MTKVLIIGGLGYWGTNLCRVFRKLVGKDNLLLADPKLSEWLKDKEKFASLGRDFLLTGMEYSRLMYEADAVVVATPPKSHFAIAKECLEAGKHVLVEKPLALSSMDAHTLYGLAKLKGLTLMVDDTWAYHDKAFETIKALVANYERWTTAELRWYNPRATVSEEGILWTQGPHAVSLAITLLGGTPQVWRGPFVSERQASFQLYRGDHQCLVQLRWDVPRKRRSIEATIIGAKHWYELRQPAIRYVDDGKHGKPNQEPLGVMASTFLASCNAAVTSKDHLAWQDTRAVQVVELLEQVQQLAKQVQA